MSNFFRKKNSTDSTAGSSVEERPVEMKETKTMSGSGMTGKKPETVGSAPNDVKAILGKGSEFEGKLRFDGTARIDGKFKGEVMSAGTIIIGEQATIEGDLDVDGAIVSGEVRGNITAKSRIELHAPAKLYGNIAAPILVIQEGVIFDGNCQMGKQGATKPAPPKPAATTG
jgi:cytoskeletal protein CcmA (bactofilin family)